MRSGKWNKQLHWVHGKCVISIIRTLGYMEKLSPKIPKPNMPKKNKEKCGNI